MRAARRAHRPALRARRRRLRPAPPASLLLLGRDQVARHAGIAEERHRRPGAREHDRSESRQRGDGLIGKVRQPFDRRRARAALPARRKCLAHQRAAGGGGDARGGSQPALAQAHGRRETARSARRAQQRRRPRDRRVARRAAAARWRATAAAPFAGPSGNRAERSASRSGRAPSMPRRSLRRRRAPARRPNRCGGPRPRPDAPAIRCRWSSGASAARCQVAWSPIRLTIGERARRASCRYAMPLAKPGPRCSSVSPASPPSARSRRPRPCRRLRRDTARRASPGLVERAHHRHLGGAGIGEADVDARVDQRANQTLGAVHGGHSTRCARGR